MTGLNIDESPRFRQIIKLKASSIMPAIRYLIGGIDKENYEFS